MNDLLLLIYILAPFALFAMVAYFFIALAIGLIRKSKEENKEGDTDADS